MDLKRRRQFRDHVYEVFAEVGKALANGRRLVLLDLLCQAKRSVDEISAETGFSVASVSQHLQILRAAGLAASRRDGVHVYYRVANSAAADLWRALRVFSEEELPAVDRVVESYLPDRLDEDMVTAAELRELLEKDDVVLIDGAFVVAPTSSTSAVGVAATPASPGRRGDSGT